MRRALASGLAAGLLLTTAAGVTIAQDEELRMGDDPAYFERFEVPEAGIAVSFPPDWTVKIEMREGELASDDAAEPPTRYWDVLYASAEGSAWCDIAMYELMAGDLSGLADRLADNFVEDYGGGATAAVAPLELAVGDTYRIAVSNPDAGRLTTMYLFDSGSARYYMSCMTDLADDATPDDIVDTVEWLAERVEPEPAPIETLTPSLGGQRVEVPAAGIALTIPATWTYEVVMETGDYQLPAELDDGSTVPYTYVVSVGPPGSSLCILSTYEDMPMGLERHAQEHGQQNTSRFLETDPIVREIELPGGQAFQVDYQATLGWGQAYLFDMAGVRNVLDCFAEDADEDALRSVAASIELLHTEATDEPELTDPSEPSIDDRRVEIPEADLALTIPHFWTYKIVLEDLEYQLPDEFGEGASVSRTHVLSAFPLIDGTCFVEAFRDMPMDIERHAWEHGWAFYSSLSETTPDVTRVQLPAGEAFRVDYESLFGHSLAYVFDMTGTRWVVACWGGGDGGSGARTIASSMAPLDDEPPALGLQRLELAEAGIALTLPTDWEVLPEVRSIGPASFSEDPDTPEVDMWAVMNAHPIGDDWCGVYLYDGIPLSLDDHGRWFEHLATTNYDPPKVAEVDQATLPIGDAVRVIETSEDGTVDTVYLFDVAGDREYLICGTANQPDDAWLSVAESIELLGVEPLAEVPSGVPDDAQAWDEVGPFGSIISVDETRVMRARCEQALWIEFADDTFEERIECVLTDDPVDPPDSQGVVPTETVTLQGGECEWVSDFWIAYDGSEVWAESWTVTVEPDGTVVGTSTYGAEMLDCSEG